MKSIFKDSLSSGELEKKEKKTNQQKDRKSFPLKKRKQNTKRIRKTINRL